mgnify:CR=1 FL=1
MLLSVALILILAKSNMTIESNVSIYFKVIYIAVFGIVTFMYSWVKRRLAEKLSNKSLSITISRVYYYIYLGVVTFVSRFVMAYILKENVVDAVSPGISEGLGSYINYGLGLLVKNQMYANVIINTVLAFLSCIVIKKIILNITENDTVATVTSIMYLLIPQSLVYVTSYVKYGYNVLLVLIGIMLFTKIIDEVKNFGKKSKKYLIYSLILGIIQALDVVLGGWYLLWVSMLVFVTLAAMYIDTVHIRIKFKQKLGYKLKIFLEKIEKINISKLIVVAVIVLLMSGIATLVYELLFNVDNYKMFSVSNSVNVLMHSRNYYLVLLIFSLVFEIIGIILKRKLDVKMFMIKVAMITSGMHTFFMPDSIYSSAVFDTLLVLTVIANICNICYNREEKIKLLSNVFTEPNTLINIVVKTNKQIIEEIDKVKTSEETDKKKYSYEDIQEFDTIIMLNNF